MFKKIHLLFIPLLLLYSLLFSQGNEPLVLIANKSVSVTNISKQNLRRIYLGEKQNWDDGKKLIAVNLPANHPLRQKFQSKVLGMSSEELQKFWSDEQIKGNIVKPPINQSSPKAVKLFVSKIPGAIGYVPKSMVDNTVKIIKIDGKSAENAGYLLK